MSLRSDIEKDIYAVIDEMDPSGKNTKRLRDYFKTMSDKQFYVFMDKYFDDPNRLISVAYEPYNNPVTLSFVHKVAKNLNVPIYERVYRPYVTEDLDDPPGTVHPVMVLDCVAKRLKQAGSLKNHASTAANKRDPKTGQVTGEDRTARVTDVEAFSLLAEGQYNAAQEFYGPMADDTEAYYEMLRAIQRDGEVELSSLPNDTTSKVAMNTVNVFMIGSGIESNMIDESGYMLPVTLKGANDRLSTIER